ncbi:hypothetical protein [Nonomuraea salmonea]|uniref:hypothetical protein n=1 Tax=Nonomuraea salmonea TaxID=46181 RepID=UPI003CD08448
MDARRAWLRIRVAALSSPDPANGRPARGRTLARMHIRLRLPADLDACVEALAQVQATDRYPVDWPSDPGGWLTPSDLTSAWVAVEDGAVLGHVGLTRDAEIVRLFRHPGRARPRPGRPPPRRRPRRHPPGPLKLEVSSEGTTAIALYERTGWRHTGTTRGRWLNAAGEPALLHHYTSP